MLASSADLDVRVLLRRKPDLYPVLEHLLRRLHLLQVLRRPEGPEARRFGGFL